MDADADVPSVVGASDAASMRHRATSSTPSDAVAPEEDFSTAGATQNVQFEEYTTSDFPDLEKMLQDLNSVGAGEVQEQQEV